MRASCLILDTFMALGRGVDPRIIRGLSLYLVEWQPRVIANYLQQKTKRRLGDIGLIQLRLYENIHAFCLGAGLSRDCVLRCG